MNKIIYIIIILVWSSTIVQAADKRDCSGIKKLSKEFIACKTGNIKAGIVNAGSSIKKNTVDKAKKTETEKEPKTTNKVKIEETTNKVKKVASEKAKSFSNKAKSFGEGFSNIFKGSTKQYPKGIQK